MRSSLTAEQPERQREGALEHSPREAALAAGAATASNATSSLSIASSIPSPPPSSACSRQTAPRARPRSPRRAPAAPPATASARRRRAAHPRARLPQPELRHQPAGVAGGGQRRRRARGRVGRVGAESARGAARAHQVTKLGMPGLSSTATENQMRTRPPSSGSTPEAGRVAEHPRRPVEHPRRVAQRIVRHEAHAEVEAQPAHDELVADAVGLHGASTAHGTMGSSIRDCAPVPRRRAARLGSARRTGGTPPPPAIFPRRGAHLCTAKPSPEPPRRSSAAHALARRERARLLLAQRRQHRAGPGRPAAPPLAATTRVARLPHDRRPARRDGAIRRRDGQ